MSEHLPLILVELVLVFGGALVFAWWQFRDLRRERERRAAAHRSSERTSDKERHVDEA